MTCKITIQTVGNSIVADVAVEDHGGLRHSAWRSDKETTLEDVVATLPQIVSQLMAKPALMEEIV